MFRRPELFCLHLQEWYSHEKRLLRRSPVNNCNYQLQLNNSAVRDYFAYVFIFLLYLRHCNKWWYVSDTFSLGTKQIIMARTSQILMWQCCPSKNVPVHGFSNLLHRFALFFFWPFGKHRHTQPNFLSWWISTFIGKSRHCEGVNNFNWRSSMTYLYLSHLFK